MGNTFHVIDGGDIPFTAQEEAHWNKDISSPHVHHKKISELEAQLGIGTEGIIDSMRKRQRKRLPVDMQNQYSELKQLRIHPRKKKSWLFF